MDIKLPPINMFTIIQFFGRLIIASGIIGFSGCFFSNIFPESTQLPLGDVEMIAVDSQGIIYCSSEGYSRIQQYSATGQFLNSWQSPCKHPDIIIDKKDQLNVVSNDFNKNKKIFNISSGKITNDDTKLPVREKRLSQKIGEATYTVNNQMVWPQVIKTLPDGTSVTIVQDSFFLWMISGPLQAVLRFILGGFILWILNNFFREEIEDAK